MCAVFGRREPPGRLVVQAERQLPGRISGVQEPNGAGLVEPDGGRHVDARQVGGGTVVAQAVRVDSVEAESAGDDIVEPAPVGAPVRLAQAEAGTARWRAELGKITVRAGRFYPQRVEVGRHAASPQPTVPALYDDRPARQPDREAVLPAAFAARPGSAAGLRPGFTTKAEGPSETRRDSQPRPV